jgi:hypothetical protein
MLKPEKYKYFKHRIDMQMLAVSMHKINAFSIDIQKP